MSEKNLERLKRAVYALMVIFILILLTNSIVLYILNRLSEETGIRARNTIEIIRSILIILFLILRSLRKSLNCLM